MELKKLKELPIGTKFIIPNAPERKRGLITLTGMANGVFHVCKHKKGPNKRMYLIFPHDLLVIPVKKEEV